MGGGVGCVCVGGSVKYLYIRGLDSKQNSTVAVYWWFNIKHKFLLRRTLWDMQAHKSKKCSNTVSKQFSSLLW